MEPVCSRKKLWRLVSMICIIFSLIFCTSSQASANEPAPCESLQDVLRLCRVLSLLPCCSLFARLDDRLRNAEDQKEKSDLKKLNRKLKEVHNELEEHNQVLARFLSAPESEWEGLVAAGRGSLSTSFFAHLENLLRANHDDIPKRDGKYTNAICLPAFLCQEHSFKPFVCFARMFKTQSCKPHLSTSGPKEKAETLLCTLCSSLLHGRIAEMARIATRLLMLCDALDKVVQDQTAMEAAGQEFKNLLETVSAE